MGVVKLQNQTDFWAEIGLEPPTIVIKKGDPEWEEAYGNWLAQKDPTSSKEWKKGVFGICDWPR